MRALSRAFTLREFAQLLPPGAESSGRRATTARPGGPRCRPRQAWQCVMRVKESVERIAAAVRTGRPSIAVGTPQRGRRNPCGR
ncbi:hypothetical protein QF035_006769 [Streptomyces umbrinus]|uniref:Transposase n=1 Tax=Streptomyces umbrinus TaxID=67370 RepID=A0ABU0T0G3_9ACTN|nr:hypothetical protein [Streptomyces umbrinus]MDQ1029187.1 hypothetical protein [Streptomyces umbrinus]